MSGRQCLSHTCLKTARPLIPIATAGIDAGTTWFWDIGASISQARHRSGTQSSPLGSIELIQKCFLGWLKRKSFHFYFIRFKSEMNPSPKWGAQGKMHRERKVRQRPVLDGNSVLLSGCRKSTSLCPATIATPTARQTNVSLRQGQACSTSTRTFGIGQSWRLSLVNKEIQSTVILQSLREITGKVPRRPWQIQISLPCGSVHLPSLPWS